MKLKAFIWLIFLVLFTDKAYTYVPYEGNINGYIGPYVYKTNYSSSNTNLTSPTMTGGGLVILGDINKFSSLEFGLYYLNKIFFRSEDSKFLSEKTAIAQTTMGYRYWFNSSFSASISFLSAYTMGPVDILYSDFTTDQNFTTSARDITDYAVDFAVQYEFLKLESLTLNLDTRYGYMLTAKNGERADQFSALIGIKFVLQDKDSIQKKRLEQQQINSK